MNDEDARELYESRKRDLNFLPILDRKSPYSNYVKWLKFLQQARKDSKILRRNGYNNYALEMEDGTRVLTDLYYWCVRQIDNFNPKKYLLFFIPVFY